MWEVSGLYRCLNTCKTTHRSQYTDLDIRTGVFYALGILDKDELPICNSEEDSEDDTDKNEDSDIEEDDASENDDVIQTMRNSLTVSTVYTDGDNDVPVDAIILSSSEDNDKYMYSCM